jgi:hypothetical protein
MSDSYILIFWMDAFRKDITLTLSLQVIPQEIAALTLATEVKIIKRALSDLDRKSTRLNSSHR